MCYALGYKLNRKIDARTEFRIDDDDGVDDEKMWFLMNFFLEQNQATFRSISNCLAYRLGIFFGAGAFKFVQKNIEIYIIVNATTKNLQTT